MSMRITRAAFEQLVNEDLEWLLKQPRTLERDHIAQILREAPAKYYDEPRLPRPVDEPSP